MVYSEYETARTAGLATAQSKSKRVIWNKSRTVDRSRLKKTLNAKMTSLYFTLEEIKGYSMF